MSLQERIKITKKKVDEIESEILFKRHIERYALARKYLYGKVCDVACGVGYGAYLCSKNPNIVSIDGFDIDEKSVIEANNNFKGEQLKFYTKDINSINGNFDMLISLETIEHLDNPASLFNLVERCNINEIIISFPNKKTTHYNKWHLWDISPEDIGNIFSTFYVLDSFDFYDSKFMHLVRGKPDCKNLKLWNSKI